MSAINIRVSGSKTAPTWTIFRSALKYTSPNHLDTHIAYLMHAIPIHNARVDLYQEYRAERLLMSFSTPPVFSDLCPGGKIEPHAFGCKQIRTFALNSPASIPACSCEDKAKAYAKGWLDIDWDGGDDDRASSGHLHEEAKDPLWRTGKFWSYCKECGEWMQEWTGEKKL